MQRPAGLLGEKRGVNNTMKPYILISIIALALILWFILIIAGVNPPYIALVFLEGIEWITKYILPWIMLLLLMKLVKNTNKK